MQITGKDYIHNQDTGENSSGQNYFPEQIER